jgi:MbtH protein
MWPLDDDTVVLKVVVNDEEQYSYWPADREIPSGWHDTGVQGTKDECGAYVRQVWTDMRPKSLREAMDGPSTAS